jgi:hypothetical protein
VSAWSGLGCLLPVILVVGLLLFGSVFIVSHGTGPIPIGPMP